MEVWFSGSQQEGSYAEGFYAFMIYPNACGMIRDGDREGAIVQESPTEIFEKVASIWWGIQTPTKFFPSA